MNIQVLDLSLLYMSILLNCFTIKGGIFFFFFLVFGGRKNLVFIHLLGKVSKYALPLF